MKLRTKIVVAVAVAASTQQANAQTGTRFNRIPEVEASVEGIRFGQCLANYRPREADAWLATTPGTGASNTAHEALIPRHETHCVQFGAITIGGSSLRFSPRCAVTSPRAGISRSMRTVRRQPSPMRRRP